MPIYAYRCASCGHAQDVLQKLSDPLLTVCPACGAPTYVKQLTAAGFQLKGSGWYATDFRGGNVAKPEADAAEASPKDGDGDAKKPAEAAKDGVAADAKKPVETAAKPVTPVAAPAVPKGGAPAAGGSGSAPSA